MDSGSLRDKRLLFDSVMILSAKKVLHTTYLKNENSDKLHENIKTLQELIRSMLDFLACAKTQFTQ